MRFSHRPLLLTALLALCPACGSGSDPSKEAQQDAQSTSGDHSVGPGSDVARPPSGCDPGLSNCGGQCVNTLSDPRHCSGCNKPCAPGEVCVGGSCSKPPDCRQTPCAGFSYCDLNNGVCMPGCAFDTQCTKNESCDFSHACACKAGFHRCNAVCVSNLDVQTCGASCSVCPVPVNAVATCDGVNCGSTCKIGFHNCGGACVADNDPKTCGKSCTACPTPPNGVASCDGKSCGSGCAPGFKPCGSSGVCAVCCNHNDCPTGNICVPGTGTCVAGCGVPGTTKNDGLVDRCPAGQACQPTSCDWQGANCKSFSCTSQCNGWPCKSDPGKTYVCWAKSNTCMLECQSQSDCSGGKLCQWFTVDPPSSFNATEKQLCADPCSGDPFCKASAMFCCDYNNYWSCTCKAGICENAGLRCYRLQ